MIQRSIREGRIPRWSLTGRLRTARSPASSACSDSQRVTDISRPVGSSRSSYPAMNPGSDCRSASRDLARRSSSSCRIGGSSKIATRATLMTRILHGSGCCLMPGAISGPILLPWAVSFLSTSTLPSSARRRGPHGAAIRAGCTAATWHAAACTGDTRSGGTWRPGAPRRRSRFCRATWRNRPAWSPFAASSLRDLQLLAGLLDRECHRHSRGDAELREDVSEVSLHGLLREEELLRDLAIRALAMDKRRDLPLAGAERTERRRRRKRRS